MTDRRSQTAALRRKSAPRAEAQALATTQTPAGMDGWRVSSWSRKLGRLNLTVHDLGPGPACVADMRCAWHIRGTGITLNGSAPTAELAADAAMQMITRLANKGPIIR